MSIISRIGGKVNKKTLLGATFFHKALFHMPPGTKVFFDPGEEMG